MNRAWAAAWLCCAFPEEEGLRVGLPSPSDLGKQIVGQLGVSLGSERFSKYFKGNAWIVVEGRRVIVEVPNGFHADLLARQFGQMLREAAQSVVGNSAVDVEWRVDPACVARLRPKVDRATAPEAPVRLPAPPRREAKRPPPARLRLADLTVGASNELAFAGVSRLADPNADRAFSCLFLYGGYGVGKTHFLQGAAGAYAEAKRSARVVYTTGERFANEFIASTHAQTLDAFRERYRRLDLLCIDDIQFVIGKVKTTQELLHTLEALDHSGARVVLSGEAHPSRLTGLSPRLVSRCLAGMVVELQLPDREMRLRIVERVARSRGLHLEPAAIDALADAPGGLDPVCGSVRELQGAIARVEALSTLLPDVRSEGGSIGVALVHKALGGARPAPPRPIRVPLVASHVCRSLGVDLSDLMGRGRHKRVVLARSMVSYLARRLTSHSYPEIARALNRQNHSTIVTACQRMERAIEGGVRCDAGPDLDQVLVGELAERLRAEIVRENAS